jgi:hypothetical protein
MTRIQTKLFPILAAVWGLFALGCESGGVGDPCTPEDEYLQDFNGFAISEVNIESKSFQCITRVCLVNHFQGRVSCPYGQTQADIDGQPPDAGVRCRVPGTNGETTVPPNDPNGVNIDEIRVPVSPQVKARSAVDAVYCSCRCGGPDPNARYCECPSGYECAELVKEIGLGKEQLAGNYCVKAGTVYNPQQPGSAALCEPPTEMQPQLNPDPKCTETGLNPPHDVAAEE